MIFFDKRKVLLISYDWPPKGSVGMLRMVKFARHLVMSGYDVSVITKDDSNSGTIYWDVEEPALEKVKTYRIAPANGISFFDRVKKRIQPQFEIDWYRAVEGRLEALMEKIDCDVVISSSPPESTHVIAAMIKERYKKKWIADLRDLWSQDHYRNFNYLRRALLFREEKNVLKKADCILTVSQAWERFLKTHYGERVKFIPNGYDEEYFSRIPRETSAKFTVSYLGKINSAHQDISLFLAAIEEIVKSSKIPGGKIEVNFYVSGYGKPDIAGLASKYGLSGVVKEFAPVPLSRAFRIMKNSSVLLLVGWKGLSADGWRPQKLYEYMGSGTPVLLVNGVENKELAEVLAATGSGSMVNSRADIIDKICGYYSDFVSGTPHAGFRATGRLAEYTASRITDELCRLIG